MVNAGHNYRRCGTMTLELVWKPDMSATCDLACQGYGFYCDLCAYTFGRTPTADISYVKSSTEEIAKYMKKRIYCCT